MILLEKPRYCKIKQYIIMAKAFEFQKGGLNRLKKFYKAASGIHKRAGVGLSNNLAFRARGMILKELEQSMTMRSKGFVKGSVRVQKAGRSNPVAEVGSIKRARFSGWIEQETGQKTTRKRTQTKTARMSNWQRRVSPRFRLKPGSKRSIRPSDLGLSNTESSSIPVFLQILSRKKYRQPWFIPIRYKRLQRGIYIFRANKIRRIQNLDPANPQPKRNRWMTRTVSRINQRLVEEEWGKSIRFHAGKLRF